MIFNIGMFIIGIENLSKLAENRQYGELLNPLQAIIEVNKHFQQYTQIPKIKVKEILLTHPYGSMKNHDFFLLHFEKQDLSLKVQEIQERLATQITADFHNTLGSSMTTISGVPGGKLSLAQLQDAASVLSVLEDQKVKIDLLKWFIGK